MTAEIEELTEMFSGTSIRLISATQENRDLKTKFDDFCLKSESYAAQCEHQIGELTTQCSDWKEKYSSFDARFQVKQTECDTLNAEKQRLEEELGALQKVQKTQQKQLTHFEGIYKGVDITYLHEEIEGLKTGAHSSQVQEKVLEAQLYELRDQILKITNEYHKVKAREIKKMPAINSAHISDFSDQDEAVKVKEREAAARKA